jgi:hypothetical protein
MGYGSSETFARSLVTIACTVVYTAEFTMSPQGDATIVAWAMRGPAPFIPKLMQVFMNLDRTIGKDFEVGLANLKGVAEK